MIADGAYSIYISGYHSSERRDVAYLRTQSPLGCHESDGPGRRRYSISKPPRYEDALSAATYKRNATTTRPRARPHHRSPPHLISPLSEERPAARHDRPTATPRGDHTDNVKHETTRPLSTPTRHLSSLSAAKGGASAALQTILTEDDSRAHRGRHPLALRPHGTIRAALPIPSSSWTACSGHADGVISCTGV